MIKIMHGNVLDKLRILENESVNCVVTSPPYWRLRDYGSDQQIGLEETPEEFIEKLCNVFDEVYRVLKKDGTVLDPFMGSGTTNIASAKLGIKSIGIELMKDNIEIAKKRITREVEESGKNVEM